MKTKEILKPSSKGQKLSKVDQNDTKVWKKLN